LGAAFFWEENDSIRAKYRKFEELIKKDRISYQLTDNDAIELARREIGMTIGLDCSARFVVAGGIFKAIFNVAEPKDTMAWDSPNARGYSLAGCRNGIPS